MDARWMKLDYPAFVHVANSLTPIPWPGWRPLQHAAQLNLALSACKPARRTAALLKRREGLGGRRVWGGGQRQQAAQLALTIVDEKPADVVWWDEGAPVQSLEIRCSDEKGNVLDPWQLSELLMAMGSMSVSVDDSSRGTDAEVPVLRDHFAPQAFDRSVAAASETGTKQMWGGSSRVLALFPAKWDLAGVIAGVEEIMELASPLSFAIENVEDKDWMKTVQEGWDPIESGRLRVRFPWHEPLPPSQLEAGKVELVLEGGRAFGTGEHPTTSMCCKWLEDVSEGSRVLDYGSGSGILGLAALKFGAAEAIGVELDLDSIASAAINAANNGLVMDTFYPQEIGSGEDVDLLLTKLLSIREEPLPGTMEVLPIADGEAIPTSGLGTFDITVANILAGPIVRLQPVFANLTKPGGQIALSGLLAEQAQTVMEAYKDNFDVKVTDRLGGWVLVSGFRRGD